MDFALSILLDPFWGYVIWGGIALLALLLLVRRPAALELAGDDRGRLSISRHALHRLVEACCEQVKGVAGARAKVAHRGGKFHTEVRLRIRPNARLDAIQGYLVQEITSIYTQNLGLKDIGPIDIKVVGASSENSF